MTKRVLLKPSSGKTFLNNKIYREKITHNIFHDFDKLLKKKSIQIDTYDLMKKGEPIDLVLCANLPYPWEFFVWWFLLTVKCKKKVLLVLESPIIVPHNHYKFFHWFFDTVYTWNDSQADGNKTKKLSIPYNNLDAKIQKKKFKDKKLISFINSNKNVPWLFQLLSPSKKNLYNERIRALTFFEENHPDEFDLYGRGWNLKNNSFNFNKSHYKKFFKTYKGAVEDKFSILPNYKFSICFENSAADGYISEKILDCFKAKNVPIYLGAPNITKYISKDAFIDFRDFSSYEDLHHFIANMSEKTHANYIKAGQDFLNSKEMEEKKSNKNLLKIITELVK